MLVFLKGLFDPLEDLHLGLVELQLKIPHVSRGFISQVASIRLHSHALPSLLLSLPHTFCSWQVSYLWCFKQLIYFSSLSPSSTYQAFIAYFEAYHLPFSPWGASRSNSTLCSSLQTCNQSTLKINKQFLTSGWAYKHLSPLVHLGKY